MQFVCILFNGQKMEKNKKKTKKKIPSHFCLYIGTGMRAVCTICIGQKTKKNLVSVQKIKFFGKKQSLFSYPPGTILFKRGLKAKLVISKNEIRQSLVVRNSFSKNQKEKRNLFLLFVPKNEIFGKKNYFLDKTKLQVLEILKGFLQKLCFCLLLKVKICPKLVK